MVDRKYNIELSESEYESLIELLDWNDRNKNVYLEGLNFRLKKLLPDLPKSKLGFLFIETGDISNEKLKEFKEHWKQMMSNSSYWRNKVIV